ncbi:MAG: hypothetical protein ACNS60_00730 [Candidatus Cyclobacteriaceae bacterium M2_1C_046]
MTKKKEQAPPPQEGPSSQQDRERSYERPKSFEELLREFSEGPQEAKRQEEPQEEYMSYEDEEEDVESYEDEYARDQEAREVYDRSVKQAKNLKTIDELVDYDQVKTKLEIDKFDPYAIKKKNTLADSIRRDLQKSNEVRKAVIYAEILNRKY